MTNEPTDPTPKDPREFTREEVAEHNAMLERYAIWTTSHLFGQLHGHDPEELPAAVRAGGPQGDPSRLSAEERSRLDDLTAALTAHVKAGGVVSTAAEWPEAQALLRKMHDRDSGDE